MAPGDLIPFYLDKAKMYFSNLESFKQAVDNAKKICVEVTLTDGSVVSSSGVPIEVMPSVFEDMEAFWLNKDSFSIWMHSWTDELREGGKVETFAYASVRSIAVRIIK